jgi:hypothetical protein
MAPSTADELQRLAELRAQGDLTEEEFTAAKAKLLGTWRGRAIVDGSDIPADPARARRLVRDRGTSIPLLD